MRRHDERAQSITLNYTIGLSIGVVLVTGLLIGGTGFVQDQQERAIRAELQVIGQQVSADITATDRLVQSGSADTATVKERLPETVVGSTYTVEVVAQEDPYLRLSSTDPEVTVEVDVANQTALNATSADGGKMRISYTDKGISLIDGGGS